MTAPVLLWAESLLGSGHLQRALVLARALAEAGLAPTLATGSPLPAALPPGVGLVRLPPVRAADAAFAGLCDGNGRPVDDAWRSARRAALEGAFERLAPRLLVTEMFPFGRRAFAFELLPLLRLAPCAVASVRDVLVRSRPEKEAWMRDVALAHYRLVLIHGDPAFLAFDESFPHAAELSGRLVHTGYVAADAAPPAAGPSEVLVSAGGGAVGARLLAAALAARPLTRLAAAPWRLIAGRAMAEETFRALRGRLPAGVALERHRDDFRAMLANCLLSVSQAGYNTVVEGLRLATPMVLVPFAATSETEQTMRALRLAEHRLAFVVPEDALAPAALARAVEGAQARGRVPAAIDLGGAGRSARLLTELARGLSS